MKAVRRWVLVLFAVSSGIASAQQKPAATEEARHHFEEGTKAFNLGEFARAIDEYKQAYNAKPDPVFLYNIAQSYRLMGNLPQAVFFYRSFLRNMPNAPNRRQIADRVEQLEAQIEREKAVSTAPPNNTVPPGTPPAPSEEPAPTRPAPTTPEAKPVEAAPATTAPSAEKPAVETRAELTGAPPAKTPVYKKWWLWTIVGVVVVGATVGAAVGATASSAPPPPGSHFGTTTVSF